MRSSRSALNVLVGYGGLVSLGHAGLFGVTCLCRRGHLLQPVTAMSRDLLGLAVTLAAMAVFAALALRATGIGFLMITLALGQILWGLAYRWISVTNGDNGISVHGRPAPFGLAARVRTGFYYATLVVFLVAVAAVAVFVQSPFGAALQRHARPAAAHECARLQCVG